MQAIVLFLVSPPPLDRMRFSTLCLTLFLASGTFGTSADAQVKRLPASPTVLTQAPGPQARWMKPGGEPVTEIAGYRVADYRDAGEGGLDWTLTGEGAHSGWGTRQLWMGTAPLAAHVQLDVESEAVAFMMDGDGNDGFATYVVDGQEIGTWDMYGRAGFTLVVTNLPMKAHRLEVRMTGQKRAASHAAHVSMYGGSALVKDVIAAR